MDENVIEHLHKIAQDIENVIETSESDEERQTNLEPLINKLLSALSNSSSDGK
jgi:hypothetical protein